MRKCHRGLMKDGFTLVEILIVIGIIAVLSGLLLPVLRAAREKPRTTACVSNLKQLHSAFAMYASDNNGILPPYQNKIGFRFGESEGGPERSVPENGAALVSSLFPYTKSNDIWFCPADYLAKTDSEAGHVRHQFSSYRTGIFMGMELTTGESTTMDGPSRLSARRGPDLILLLTDHLWPPSDESGPLYSHNERANSLFFDGHVTTKNRSTFFN